MFGEPGWSPWLQPESDHNWFCKEFLFLMQHEKKETSNFFFFLGGGGEVIARLVY